MRRLQSAVVEMKCPIATIEITIPEATPLTSQLMRMQWYMRAGKVKRYARLIRAQIAGLGIKTATRAKVFIERHSTGTPDWDGVAGGCKLLLDAMTARHPSGAGIIKDDSIEVIGKPEYEAVKCRKGEAKTVVTIEVIE